MRSIGNVQLTLGLVSCAVQLHSAIDSHDRKSSMYHRHDDDSYHPIQMPRMCSGCSEAISQGDLVKGFEHDAGTVMLTPDDMATIDANEGTGIEILRFVRAKQVNPMLFSGEKCYFLGPDTDPKRGGKSAAATYLTIKQVLAEEDLVGVVSYTRWRKNRIALLRVEDTEYGGVLVLQNLLWEDELRKPEIPSLMKGETVVDPRLLPVCRSVVASMTEDWAAGDYHDVYEEQLTAAITAKAAGQEIELVEVEDAPAPDDIEALLAKLAATAAAKKAPAKKVAPKVPAVALDAAPAEAPEVAPAAEVPKKKAPAKKAAPRKRTAA